MNTELCLKIKSKKEVRNTINKVSAYKVRQPLGIKCNIIIFCEYMDFNVWLIFLCHHFSLPQMIWNTESQNVKFQWGTQFTSCNIFQTRDINLSILHYDHWEIPTRNALVGCQPGP